MEEQEKRSLADLYHAVVRAVGTLLPPGEERKRPAVRLEGGGLEEELPLKRKRLSPAAGKRLKKTLRRYPEGTAVGLALWPRTQGGRLDLKASQVGNLHVHPNPEKAGTFSVLGLPQAWEPEKGRLVLEVRPNREGFLRKPFALELHVPPALRPSLPPVGEGEGFPPKLQNRGGKGVGGPPPPPSRPTRLSTRPALASCWSTLAMKAGGALSLSAISKAERPGSSAKRRRA